VAVAAAFVAYVGLHLACVAGLRAARYPDTPSYLRDPDFTGGATRLWTVPLFNWILPSDALRVGGQAVLAAASWWILAAVASDLIEDRRVRLGLRGVLLVLGLTHAVVTWNAVILSESLAISLTVLLIAGWLWYGRRPSMQRAGAVLVVTVLWTFARQAHVVAGAVVAGVFLVVVLVRHRERAWAALAAGLVVVRPVPHGSWAAACRCRPTWINRWRESRRARDRPAAGSTPCSPTVSTESGSAARASAPTPNMP
jgi:hypothetical protein